MFPIKKPSCVVLGVLTLLLLPDRLAELRGKKMLRHGPHLGPPVTGRAAVPGLTVNILQLGLRHLPSLSGDRTEIFLPNKTS